MLTAKFSQICPLHVLVQENPVQKASKTLLRKLSPLPECLVDSIQQLFSAETSAFSSEPSTISVLQTQTIYQIFLKSKTLVDSSSNSFLIQHLTSYFSYFYLHRLTQMIRMIYLSQSIDYRRQHCSMKRFYCFRISFSFHFHYVAFANFLSLSLVSMIARL